MFLSNMNYVGKASVETMKVLHIGYAFAKDTDFRPETLMTHKSGEFGGYTGNKKTMMILS